VDGELLLERFSLLPNGGGNLLDQLVKPLEVNLTFPQWLLGRIAVVEVAFWGAEVVPPTSAQLLAWSLDGEAGNVALL